VATIKRAPSQTLVAFACHQELLRGLDNSRYLSGVDRSNFIRQAIIAELRLRNLPVKPEWALAPDRAKKVRYAPVAPKPVASSAKASGAATKRAAAASAPKRKAATRARGR